MAKTLTPAQIKKIRESWTVWESNLITNGPTFFHAFFVANPQYKNVFRIFRDLRLEELKDNPKLKAHALILMRSLTSVIDSLEEADMMVDVLTKIADSHYSRGVRIKHFEDLFGVFNQTMSGILGSCYDDATGEAWGCLTTMMLSVLDEQLAHKKATEK